MWLLQLGNIDQRVFFVFCVVAYLVAGSALAAIIAGVVLNDPSNVMRWGIVYCACGPGHTVSYLLNLSTLAIAAAVLLRGVDTDWATQPVADGICKVFVVLNVIGYTVFFASLFTKIMVVFRVYGNRRVSQRFAELQSVVTVIVWVTIAAILTVVWEIVWTPTAFPYSSAADATDSSLNSTSRNAPMKINYICRGPDWRDTNNELVKMDDQLVWRVAVSVFFAVLLVLALLQLPCLACTTIPRKFHTDIGLYMCTIINTVVGVLVSVLVWFAVVPTFVNDDTFMYAVVGGIQLWIVFIANSMVFVGKVITDSNCRKLTTSKESTLVNFQRYPVAAPRHAYVNRAENFV